MKAHKKFTDYTFNSEKVLKDKNTRFLLRIFTELGSTVGVIIIFLILALITGLEVLYVFIPVYLFQLFCVELIKFVFSRPRPVSKDNKNIFGLTITSGSFPSGHTSNVFALAFLISNFYQFNLFLISLAFIIAGSVGYSRILLGRHYAMDVVAGAFAGLFFALIGSQIILPIVLPILLEIFPVY